MNICLVKASSGQCSTLCTLGIRPTGGSETHHFSSLNGIDIQKFKHQNSRYLCREASQIHYVVRTPHKWRSIQFIIESKEQITKITFLSNKFEAGLFHQICKILLSAMEMNGNRLFIQSKLSSLMHDFLFDSITHINRKNRFLVDSVMT